MFGEKFADFNELYSCERMNERNKLRLEVN